MSDYPIEDGIPYRRTNKGGRAPGSKYPFRELEVNQSFFIPHRTPRNFGINGFTRKLKPKRFAALTTESDGIPGLRVWRIE